MDHPVPLPTNDSHSRQEGSSRNLPGSGVDRLDHREGDAFPVNLNSVEADSMMWDVEEGLLPGDDWMASWVTSPLPPTADTRGPDHELDCSTLLFAEESLLGSFVEDVGIVGGDSSADMLWSRQLAWDESSSCMGQSDQCGNSAADGQDLCVTGQGHMTSHSTEESGRFSQRMDDDPAGTGSCPDSAVSMTVHIDQPRSSHMTFPVTLIVPRELMDSYFHDTERTVQGKMSSSSEFLFSDLLSSSPAAAPHSASGRCSEFPAGLLDAQSMLDQLCTLDSQTGQDVDAVSLEAEWAVANLKGTLAVDEIENGVIHPEVEVIQLAETEHTETTGLDMQSIQGQLKDHPTQFQEKSTSCLILDDLDLLADLDNIDLGSPEKIGYMCDQSGVRTFSSGVVDHVEISQPDNDAVEQRVSLDQFLPACSTTVSVLSKPCHPNYHSSLGKTEVTLISCSSSVPDKQQCISFTPTTLFTDDGELNAEKSTCSQNSCPSLHTALLGQCGSSNSHWEAQSTDMCLPNGCETLNGGFISSGAPNQSCDYFVAESTQEQISKFGVDHCTCQSPQCHSTNRQCGMSCTFKTKQGKFPNQTGGSCFCITLPTDVLHVDGISSQNAQTHLTSEESSAGIQATTKTNPPLTCGSVSNHGLPTSTAANSPYQNRADDVWLNSYSTLQNSTLVSDVSVLNYKETCPDSTIHSHAEKLINTALTEKTAQNAENSSLMPELEQEDGPCISSVEVTKKRKTTNRKAKRSVEFRSPGLFPPQLGTCQSRNGDKALQTPFHLRQFRHKVFVYPFDKENSHRSGAETHEAKAGDKIANTLAVLIESEEQYQKVKEKIRRMRASQAVGKLKTRQGEFYCPPDYLRKKTVKQILLETRIRKRAEKELSSKASSKVALEKQAKGIVDHRSRSVTYIKHPLKGARKVTGEKRKGGQSVNCDDALCKKSKYHAQAGEETAENTADRTQLVDRSEQQPSPEIFDRENSCPSLLPNKCIQLVEISDSSTDDDLVFVESLMDRRIPENNTFESLETSESSVQDESGIIDRKTGCVQNVSELQSTTQVCNEQVSDAERQPCSKQHNCNHGDNIERSEILTKNAQTLVVLHESQSFQENENSTVQLSKLENDEALQQNRLQEHQADAVANMTVQQHSEEIQQSCKVLFENDPQVEMEQNTEPQATVQTSAGILERNRQNPPTSLNEGDVVYSKGHVLGRTGSQNNRESVLTESDHSCNSHHFEIVPDENQHLDGTGCSEMVTEKTENMESIHGNEGILHRSDLADCGCSACCLENIPGRIECVVNDCCYGNIQNGGESVDEDCCHRNTPDGTNSAVDNHHCKTTPEGKESADGGSCHGNTPPKRESAGDGYCHGFILEETETVDDCHCCGNSPKGADDDHLRGTPEGKENAKNQGSLQCHKTTPEEMESTDYSHHHRNTLERKCDNCHRSVPEGTESVGESDGHENTSVGPQSADEYGLHDNDSEKFCAAVGNIPKRTESSNDSVCQETPGERNLHAHHSHCYGNTVEETDTVTGSHGPGMTSKGNENVDISHFDGGISEEVGHLDGLCDSGSEKEESVVDSPVQRNTPDGADQLDDSCAFMENDSLASSYCESTASEGLSSLDDNDFIDSTTDTVESDSSDYSSQHCCCSDNDISGTEQPREERAKLDEDSLGRDQVVVCTTAENCSSTNKNCRHVWSVQTVCDEDSTIIYHPVTETVTVESDMFGDSDREENEKSSEETKTTRDEEYLQCNVDGLPVVEKQGKFISSDTIYNGEIEALYRTPFMLVVHQPASPSPAPEKDTHENDATEKQSQNRSSVSTVNRPDCEEAREGGGEALQNTAQKSEVCTNKTEMSDSFISRRAIPAAAESSLPQCVVTNCDANQAADVLQISEGTACLTLLSNGTNNFSLSECEFMNIVETTQPSTQSVQYYEQGCTSSELAEVVMVPLMSFAHEKSGLATCPSSRTGSSLPCVQFCVEEDQSKGAVAIGNSKDFLAWDKHIARVTSSSDFLGHQPVVDCMVDSSYASQTITGSVGESTSAGGFSHWTGSQQNSLTSIDTAHSSHLLAHCDDEPGAEDVTSQCCSVVNPHLVGQSASLPLTMIMDDSETLGLSTAAVHRISVLPDFVNSVDAESHGNGTSWIHCSQLTELNIAQGLRSDMDTKRTLEVACPAGCENGSGVSLLQITPDSIDKGNTVFESAVLMDPFMPNLPFVSCENLNPFDIDQIVLSADVQQNISESFEGEPQTAGPGASSYGESQTSQAVLTLKSSPEDMSQSCTQFTKTERIDKKDKILTFCAEESDCLRVQLEDFIDSNKDVCEPSKTESTAQYVDFKAVEREEEDIQILLEPPEITFFPQEKPHTDCSIEQLCVAESSAEFVDCTVWEPKPSVQNQTCQSLATERCEQTQVGPQTRTENQSLDSDSSFDVLMRILSQHADHCEVQQTAPPLSRPVSHPAPFHCLCSSVEHGTEMLTDCQQSYNGTSSTKETSRDGQQSSCQAVHTASDQSVCFPSYSHFENTAVYVPSSEYMNQFASHCCDDQLKIRASECLDQSSFPFVTGTGSQNHTRQDLDGLLTGNTKHPLVSAHQICTGNDFFGQQMNMKELDFLLLEHSDNSNAVNAGKARSDVYPQISPADCLVETCTDPQTFPSKDPVSLNYSANAGTCRVNSISSSIVNNIMCGVQTDDQLVPLPVFNADVDSHRCFRELLPHTSSGFTAVASRATPTPFSTTSVNNSISPVSIILTSSLPDFPLCAVTAADTSSSSTSAMSASETFFAPSASHEVRFFDSSPVLPGHQRSAENLEFPHPFVKEENLTLTSSDKILPEETACCTTENSFLSHLDYSGWQGTPATAADVCPIVTTPAIHNDEGKFESLPPWAFKMSSGADATEFSTINLSAISADVFTEDHCRSSEHVLLPRKSNFAKSSACVLSRSEEKCTESSGEFISKSMQKSAECSEHNLFEPEWKSLKISDSTQPKHSVSLEPELTNTFDESKCSEPKLPDTNDKSSSSKSEFSYTNDKSESLELVLSNRNDIVIRPLELALSNRTEILKSSELEFSSMDIQSVSLELELPSESETSKSLKPEFPNTSEKSKSSELLFSNSNEKSESLEPEFSNTSETSESSELRPPSTDEKAASSDVALLTTNDQSKKKSDPPGHALPKKKKPNSPQQTLPQMEIQSMSTEHALTKGKSSDRSLSEIEVSELSDHTLKYPPGKLSESRTKSSKSTPSCLLKSKQKLLPKPDEKKTKPSKRALPKPRPKRAKTQKQSLSKSDSSRKKPTSVKNTADCAPASLAILNHSDAAVSEGSAVVSPSQSSSLEVSPAVCSLSSSGLAEHGSSGSSSPPADTGEDNKSHKGGLSPLKLSLLPPLKVSSDHPLSLTLSSKALTMTKTYPLKYAVAPVDANKYHPCPCHPLSVDVGKDGSGPPCIPFSPAFLSCPTMKSLPAVAACPTDLPQYPACVQEGVYEYSPSAADIHAGQNWYSKSCGNAPNHVYKDCSARFYIQMLCIGDFTCNVDNRRYGKNSRVCFTFMKRLILYKLEPLVPVSETAATQSPQEIVTTEIDMQSIVGLWGTDNKLLLELKMPPNMYVGKKWGRKTHQQPLDITGGEIRKVPYHFITFQSSCVTTLKRHLCEHPFFCHLLVRPVTVDLRKTFTSTDTPEASSTDGDGLAASATAEDCEQCEENVQELGSQNQVCEEESSHCSDVGDPVHEDAGVIPHTTDS